MLGKLSCGKVPAAPCSGGMVLFCVGGGRDTGRGILCAAVGAPNL